MANEKSNDFLSRLSDFLFTIYKVLTESIDEVLRSIWKGQIPEIRFAVFTILACIFFRTQMDEILFRLLKHPEYVLKGRLRVIISTLIALFPWLYWGYKQNQKRKSLNNKLQFVFESMRVTSGLGLCPEYVFDEPIDASSRKLRVWANGISLEVLKLNKSKLEDGLGLTISKIAWSDERRKMIDFIYTYGALPDFYVPEKLYRFKDFQFPIGKTTTDEIWTGLKEVPHYLVAGETGTGKSTFIRMVIEILLINNRDIEIYFLDFKGGIEAQSIAEDARLHIITTYEDAVKTITEINSTLTQRGKDIAGVARDIDGYNRKQVDTDKKLKRILVVVDEVSEIFPKFNMPNKNEMTTISAGVNRIARLGRALGINLIVGTQKPDAKNLDPTVKANLGGIVCFSMSHPTQSIVVLGDGRASDLNAEIKGRAIWKHGSFTTEVQTPFLNDADIEDARNKSNLYWGVKNKKPLTSEEKVNFDDKNQGKAMLLGKNVEEKTIGDLNEK